MFKNVRRGLCMMPDMLCSTLFLWILVTILALAVRLLRPLHQHGVPLLAVLPLALLISTAANVVGALSCVLIVTAIVKIGPGRSERFGALLSDWWLPTLWILYIVVGLIGCIWALFFR